MWVAAGWWSGALAAGALLLALVLRARLRRRSKERPLVSVVRPPPPSPAPLRAPRAPRPWLTPRRVLAALAGSPADEPLPPPQIVIVQHPADRPPGAGPRLPPPERWLHARPPRYTYAALRPIAPLRPDLAPPDIAQRAREWSATRSPSLEKDERSPPAPGEVFGAGGDGCDVMSSESGEPARPRRPRAAGAWLHAPPSPRPARDGPCAPAFDFSPKLVEAPPSPRYFTPPETVSPPCSPSPRSVYYDSVRSPRGAPGPPSPRALADLALRNGRDAPPSPRAARPSPKLLSRNKENFFTFERGPEGAKASPRPRKYGGRGSMDRERPPAPPAYIRHHSCEAPPSPARPHADADGSRGAASDRDVVDCCARVAALQVEDAEGERERSAAQARRQRLKSISLDSDNAKIIERNLGLPIAKRMKDQMNEAYKQEADGAPPSPPPSPPLRRALPPSGDAQAFVEAPRFSPKEFQMSVTSEAAAPRPRRKNLRNLTIDLSVRDRALERELREFERLYAAGGGRPARTPTLKVKAASLDSAEPAGPAPPRAALSVPSTPKRQPRRVLAQRLLRGRGVRPLGACEERAGGRDSPPEISVSGAPGLSVSSTNLRTLPEGVPSDDFGPSAEEDQLGKKLHRLNSNLSLMLSAHSLGGGGGGAGGGGLRASGSSLSLDGRRRASLERRDSAGSLRAEPPPAGCRPPPGCGDALSRHSSNGSLHREPHRKGLLERRSSNTSLTLTINTSAPQLSAALSASHHSLAPPAPLARCGSRHSVEGPAAPGHGILERRSSNASLTLQPQGPRPADAPRKSLSTECLAAPGAGRGRPRPAFGSHDELSEPPRHVTTEPLSPQTTSEDFRQYLANMHQLQNASSVLSRRQLRRLHHVFQHGYSDARCGGGGGGGDAGDEHRCEGDGEGACCDYQKSLLRRLHKEFWDMPTNFQEKPLVSGSHAKNRYRGILPNEHSRVLLRHHHGYINANYIKGPEYTRNRYIATQGPLQNTVFDFWLMALQNAAVGGGSSPPPACPPPRRRVQKVVMLTNMVENNRQKCEPYFPLELGAQMAVRGEAGDARRFLVRTEGLRARRGYTVRRLHVALVGPAAPGGAPRADGLSEPSGTTVVHTGVGSDVLTRNSDLESGSSELCSRKSESGSDTDGNTDGAKSESGSGKSESGSGKSESGSGKSESGSGKSEHDSGKSECGIGESEQVLGSVTVYHYWFHNWADHKCPVDVSALLDFSLDILKTTDHHFSDAAGPYPPGGGGPAPESRFVFPPAEGTRSPTEGPRSPLAEGPRSPAEGPRSPLAARGAESGSPPAIVHCSAGIGRTGCLIAVLSGLRQLASERSVDVLGLVCNMRLDRGGMVQTSEQYELIHKVLALYEHGCPRDA